MGSFGFDCGRIQRECRLDHVAHYEHVSSTNDICRQWAATFPVEQSALAIAENQSAGRGRGSNSWWTGPGSLAVSLLLSPERRGIEMRYWSMIPLAAAVAIVRAASRIVSPIQLGVHWPNDVFLGGQKLAGVLVEGLPDARHIIGVGINVNNTAKDAPAEIRHRVTTLADQSSDEIDRAEFLMEFLRKLAETLQTLAVAPARLAEEAHAMCLQRGFELAVQRGQQVLRGTCAGIAPDGALLLDMPRGRESIHSGVILHE